MEEFKDKLHANFSRHIAKALGAMEIGNASPEMKTAVKSEFWNTFDDVFMVMEASCVSKEREE